MGRLGFGARLVLIAVTALVTVQMAAIFFSLLQRSRDTGTGLRLPLPDQTAALAQLLETSPKAQWPLVLRAASSTGLRVRITGAPPETRETPWYDAIAADLLLRPYLEALGDRKVSVHIEPPPELIPGIFSGLFEALGWASPGTVEVTVSLSTGDTLLVAADGLLSLTLLGLPPGFWTGLLGAGVTIAALAILAREARLLRTLAQAVDNLNPQQGAQAIPAIPRAAPELQALAHAVGRLSQRITNLLEARLALIANISQELRSYATRLRLRAELIPKPGEREKAAREAEDMARLLDGALLTLHIDTARRRPELVDLAEILEREADERRWAGAQVSLALAAGGPPAFTLGDPVGLRRLAASLMSNAAAHGRGLRLTVTVPDNVVVITVESHDPLPHEPSKPAQEPSEELAGAGLPAGEGANLSLAAARSAAEAHGGRLVTEEAPDGGRRIRVELPRFIFFDET